MRRKTKLDKLQKNHIFQIFIRFLKWNGILDEYMKKLHNERWGVDLCAFPIDTLISGAFIWDDDDDKWYKLHKKWVNFVNIMNVDGNKSITEIKKKNETMVFKF